jgi:SOS response regulatory protein OraA/RecX
MTNENSGNQVIGQATGNAEEKQTPGQDSKDWENQAKYFQSEKDKLYQENQKLQNYKKIGEFLESRPDITQVVSNMATGNSQGQPNAPERITLEPDEFDPWEAYNKPSSKSYKYRMQEMSDVVQSTVSEQVKDVQKAQGMQTLKSELEKRGLNDEQITDFMSFASKNPAEYGIDGVLNMWQSVQGDGNNEATEQPNSTPSPLDQVRQTQNNPAYGGILGGEQPEVKNDADEMWDGVMKAGSRKNVL